MFASLNRFISRLDSEPQQQGAQNAALESSYGFQVLHNSNPDIPVEPWFDFIVGINGHQIDDPDASLFATEVRNCAGSTVQLELWSAKGQRAHTIYIPVPASNPSLGLALQMAPLSCTNEVWHILQIPSPLSPAYLAGLIPDTDYIIGTPSGTLRGESAFGELVEDHLNRSLVLWVYNSEFDVVREVELVPRRGWGGEGALGAILGYGALHRVPVALSEEVTAPGAVMFGQETYNEKDGEPGPGIPSNDLSFVPAAMSSPPNVAPPPMMNLNAPPPSSSSPAPGRHGRKNRHVPGASPSRAFDDYFNEEAQKSKAVDFAPSRTGSVPPPPPPPKVGAPPTTATSPPPAAAEEQPQVEPEPEVSAEELLSAK